MFNSVRFSAKKVGVRYNSNDSLFLSDLLKRIDDVTSKASDIGKKRLEEQQVVNAKKAGKQSKAKGTNSTPKTKSETVRPNSNNQRVIIANHPLRNNFGQRNSAFSNSYMSANSNFSSPRSNNSSNNSKSSSPRSNNASKPRRPQIRSKPKKVFVSEIKTKKLASSPLSPKITGDTFLYGKSTSVVACTSSRIAALTKEALIDSKYPYKLPRAIIDSVETSGQTKNKFLLQKNWSTELNQDKLINRFEKIVLGKTEELQVPKKLTKDLQALTANQLLTKNGSISFQDKQLMLDVITGAKSVDSITKDAPWKQQPKA